MILIFDSKTMKMILKAYSKETQMEDISNSEEG